jgi:hypothetical protein
MRAKFFFLTLLVCAVIGRAAENYIQVSRDEKRFTLSSSGQPFTPWGLNYGNHGRLIEDFWLDDWPTVVRDFHTMRTMGANVVRVHLQFNKFMESPDRPRRNALDQLHKLVQLAEQEGLYLDLTGLACYRPADVPAWYDRLDEKDRWKAQAEFWRAIAAEGASSDAIFCYDLMNEPIVPGGHREPGKWYSGTLLGGCDFVQFISLDPAGRPRDRIARDWIRTLTAAIREVDKHHMITVGLLPWVPMRLRAGSWFEWGHLSGFIPTTVAPELDFISVHIYPEKGKLPQALDGLEKFAVGKPVVIEETFPLSCSSDELRTFLLGSRKYACGWMGHYDGQSIQELEGLKESKKITIAQSMWLDWLKLFQELGPRMRVSGPATRRG